LLSTFAINFNLRRYTTVAFDKFQQVRNMLVKHIRQAEMAGAYHRPLFGST
jgi:hypothetical protein